MQRLLQPGVLAPDFHLRAGNRESSVALAEQRGKIVLLLFFPEDPSEELIAQLAQFQQRTGPAATAPAVTIGLSPASPEAVQGLAAAHALEFPLLSDADSARSVASRYGARSEGGAVLPAAFVIDEDGLIRRAYDAGSSGRLPSPAAVERGLNKLADTPKPAPITDADWRLGSPEAPVTLIEYGDYECPHCAQAHHLAQDAVRTYGAAILLVHRHYLLRRTHPHAQAAAEAADAAGAQGKFWEMHAQLFEAELGLEREHLIVRAHTIGLDVPRFVQDLDSRRFEAAVDAKFQSAVRDKVKFPPALFINRILLEGPRTREEICRRIDGLLACTPRSAPAG
jgi:peroxiredoxin